jgi:hypothetical protein
MRPQNIVIDPLSCRSLIIKTYFDGQLLCQGTGFIVEKNNAPFLITNFHIIAGRDPVTLQPIHKAGGIPNTIKVLHHYTKQLGNWQPSTYPLFDANQNQLWLEHPTLKGIDIVALPLAIHDANIKIYPFNLNLANTDLIPTPAMSVSIIGFPLGISAGGSWPIWKTGHIATDPDVNYDGRPSFLIDATTRGGMSGSPVVIRLNGGFNTRSGNMILAGGFTTKFLGVYSGRINDDAEIGRVWRPHLINEILSLTQD